ISHVLWHCGPIFTDALVTLLSGSTIEVPLNDTVYLGSATQSLWELFLAVGYLRVLEINPSTYTLTITNKETVKVLQATVLEVFSRTHMQQLLDALIDRKPEVVKDILKDLLLNVYATRKGEGSFAETFYRGLALGLAALGTGYIVKSNRERVREEFHV